MHQHRTHLRSISFFALAALALVATSCRKEAETFKNPNTCHATSFTQQFEDIWQGFDQCYVFWSRDTVNWDSRYARFHPIFEEFDKRPNTVTDEEYKAAWQGVVQGLLDHHLSIALWNPIKQSRIRVGSVNDNRHTTDVFAQLNALKNQPGITNLVSYYVDTNTSLNSVSCLLPGKNQGGYIAYLRFSSFSLSELHESRRPNKNQLEAPLRSFFGSNYTSGVTDGLVGRPDVESIIIDLRDNPGGDSRDINIVFGNLNTRNFHFGYTRVKEGLGRLDYSSWVPFYINGSGKRISSDKPIVVLCDSNSVSCSELSCQMVKSLPNGKLIGEQTYGATCAIFASSTDNHNLTYSGCFGDQNMNYSVNPKAKGEPTDKSIFSYYVYTSTFDMVTTDYKSLEAVGVTPDIVVPYDAQALADGKDPQLEAALRYLRSNN